MSKKPGSPKKAASDPDDVLLEEKINENKVEYPQSTLLVVGLITSLLPAYFSHGVLDLSWTSLSNIPLLIIIPVLTANMLSQAYRVMIESEFWKRQRHYAERGQSLEDTKAIKSLRLQVAVGYSLFFINGIFFVLCTVLQGYVFLQMDVRASFFLSPTLTAAFLWFLAQKNEESRKRRVGRRN